MSINIPKASKQQPIRPESQETSEEQFNELVEDVIEELEKLKQKEAELKQKEAKLEKREEELEEKEARLDGIEDENIALRRENDKLHSRYQALPAIFSEVPPETDMNQSYPIIQKLNDLGLTAVYMAARKILIQILKKLRELSNMTTNIEVNWTCAAGFYRVQFPVVTLLDIIDALKDFVKELEEIHDQDLKNLISELKSKVIDKLEEG